MRLKRRHIKPLVIVVLVGLSALDHAGAFSYRADDRARYDGITATVTHVFDGDTLDIDIPDGDRDVTRIRLWGIDCPEIAHSPGESDAHFGRETADFVEEHLAGRKVRLALDPIREPRDKFARLLAYVYLDDTGEMLNELLIAEGLAYADRRFPHVFRHRFGELDRLAHRQKVGLWRDLKPNMMPAWRQSFEKAGSR